MNDLDLDNTAIAFASKSNVELQKKMWLFRTMSNPFLVGFGSKATQMAFSMGLPIKSIVKATIFTQFCGGETIEECEATIQNLGKSNIGTILDYSVEGKSDETTFDNTRNEILRVLERTTKDDNIPFAVFKITGVARFELLEKVSAKQTLDETEKAEWQRAKSRVREICERAHKINQAVFVDAEESWIQDAIDELTAEMMTLYNREKPIVYNTIQLYRHDRLEFLKRLHQQAVSNNYLLGVKLVRGAYMEKERARAIEKGYPSPIQPSKEASDEDYDATLHFCIENVDRIAVCAGSHNEKSTVLLTQLMSEKGIANDHSHVYFSQLYGMSDNLSFNLAKAGYNVSKYVPYGPVKDAMPYLIRRAQENTSVMGQVSRELEMIEREIKRRKTEQKPKISRIQENENVLSKVRKS
ncbi:MAG: proline dehydrogenase family protein [Pyrinomonadaceae bacterium]|nr:proline dehydrogenase family protein [Pyrinomonadaceae bacterium]